MSSRGGLIGFQLHNMQHVFNTTSIALMCIIEQKGVKQAT